ncbi:MAG TPA: hypothetical protein VMU47_17925 [Caldimonas sp.]|nr:hypothetical protein [Caldimonas sp.]
MRLPSGAAMAAMASHATLMIAGFLGTVIAVERAVAVRVGAAWIPPIASALGALALLAGFDIAAHALLVVSAVGLAAVQVLVARRERGAPAFVMGVAAAAWLVGDVLAAMARDPALVHAWWFAFLVLTVAGERLELTRLQRRRGAPLMAFHAIVVLLLVGAALISVAPDAGTFAYGVALLALAGWLARCDVAPRTLRIAGLGRYMALALMAAYAWLAVAGVAWCALALGAPVRDVALHALGIGFVLGMVLAHGPMIAPAILRAKIAFGPWLYVPLVALHATLVVRFAAPWAEGAWRTFGAGGNAAALALFVAAMMMGAARHHRSHGPTADASVRVPR